MPDFDKEQSARTLKVAQAIGRKLAKSVAAHPITSPDEGRVGGSPVSFLVLNKNTGHKYKVRVTEYL